MDARRRGADVSADGNDDLARFDPPLAEALRSERRRQEQFIELIASENYVSRRVLEVQGSLLTNKYADGYPGRRTYSGCEFVDVAESLAIDRAKGLFGAAHANVQPYSGTQANAAAYFALLEPGDTVLGMRAGHGGHITHGDASSFAGRFYAAVQYGVDTLTGSIDFDEVAELARAHRPKLIVAGFSAYSGSVDWERFRAIADDVGAYLLVDMAHVAGLVAAGIYPNPVPIADVTTSTTHKTLRGPRGGMILLRENGELARRVDAAVYPGIQGGPLMHVVAAKAVALAEAAEPAFAAYQRQVLANARRLARALAARGFTIVGEEPANHMLLVDLAPRGIDARAAEAALERAHIAVNGLVLPGRAVPDGLRIGTPAVTTRGFDEPAAAELGALIADVLEGLHSADAIERVRAGALELCRRFPVYSGG
jgi:glycine hydroxymethyltransferase